MSCIILRQMDQRLLAPPTPNALFELVEVCCGCHDLRGIHAVFFYPISVGLQSIVLLSAEQLPVCTIWPLWAGTVAILVWLIYLNLIHAYKPWLK